MAAIVTLLVTAGCSQAPPDLDRTVITMKFSDGYVPEPMYRTYVIKAQRHRAAIVVSNDGSEIARDEKPLPDHVWAELLQSAARMKDRQSHGCVDAGMIRIIVTEAETTTKDADEWCPGKRWDQMRGAFFEPVEVLFDMPKLLNLPPS